MRKILVLISAIALFVACDGKNKKTGEQACKNDAVKEHVAKVIPFVGEDPAIYTGTTPAASGPGIEVTLALYPDKTFQLTSVYVGEPKGENTFVDKGTYTFEKDIVVTTTANGEKKYYKLGDGELKMLTSDQKEIKGDLAKFYILKLKQ